MPNTTLRFDHHNQIYMSPDHNLHNLGILIGQIHVDIFQIDKLYMYLTSWLLPL